MSGANEPCSLSWEGSRRTHVLLMLGVTVTQDLINLPSGVEDCVFVCEGEIYIYKCYAYYSTIQWNLEKKS